MVFQPTQTTAGRPAAATIAPEASRAPVAQTTAQPEPATLAARPPAATSGPPPAVRLHIPDLPEAELPSQLTLPARPPVATRPPTPPRLASRPPVHTGRLATTRFPPPIMRSFFIPSTAPTAAHPFSDAFASGEPIAPRGDQRDSSFDLRGAEQLGPDWSDQFMAWVDEHKRYPEQALANGEDGDVAVQMNVDRYGRVTGVRVVQRSGSSWLDAGLSAMFRDARLPPFPPGSPPDDRNITFTMHYILVR